MLGIVSEVGRSDPTLSGTLEQQQRAVVMNRVASLATSGTSRCIDRQLCQEGNGSMFLFGSDPFSVRLHSSCNLAR